MEFAVRKLPHTEPSYFILFYNISLNVHRSNCRRLNSYNLLNNSVSSMLQKSDFYIFYLSRESLAQSSYDASVYPSILKSTSLSYQTNYLKLVPIFLCYVCVILILGFAQQLWVLCLIAFLV